MGVGGGGWQLLFHAIGVVKFVMCDSIRMLKELSPLKKSSFTVILLGDNIKIKRISGTPLYYYDHFLISHKSQLTELKFSPFQHVLYLLCRF